MNSPEEVIKQIQISPDFRKELTRESFYWFFVTYFPHYITCPTAEFQREMFSMMQNEDLARIAITAFRGSAKSTIATLGLPIWAMVGKHAQKYTLLVSLTQNLAKQILTNIKEELISNELLIRDFGPFLEVAEEWRADSFVIPQYNSRISAISQKESVRGIKHRQYRPSLIIIDDVEDLESVKTKESRDKLWEWFSGEIVPIGDNGTRIITVGNLLHEDSLMMRLKNSMNSGEMIGAYKEYPLLDANGKIAWKGKYPTTAHIQAKRRDVADEYAWYREYLLKFISDDRRIVQRSWIRYGSEITEAERRHISFVGIGTDLAISDKVTSDLTAFVPFAITGRGDDLKIYILPYITNKRLNFTDTIQEIKKLCNLLQEDFKRIPQVLVENVGYQTSASQQLNLERVLAEPINIKGMSKQERLEISTPYIRQGKVLFPQSGAEDLITQIVNFGIEKHDDLVDAFTIAILKILETDRPTRKSTGIVTPPRFPNMQKDPLTGTMRDFSVPITAGLIDMKF